MWIGSCNEARTGSFDVVAENLHVVVERVDVLRPADLDHRQIGPERALEQLEIGQDHQYQQPEGGQADEDGGQRSCRSGAEDPSWLRLPGSTSSGRIAALGGVKRHVHLRAGRRHRG